MTLSHFDRRLRDECLNVQQIVSLSDAQAKMSQELRYTANCPVDGGGLNK